jgi:nucleotide-binding universal stress UspA family protein
MNAHVILCPTDFSPTSERAIELASTLAAESGATLMLLHVIGPPATLDGVIDVSVFRAAEEAKDALELIRPTEPGVECVRCFEYGDVESVILRTAENEHADMIVMGTHGRTGVRRWLMGSVAEHVVRRAPCPVMTVKEPVEAMVGA